jgi:hypothetical protein
MNLARDISDSIREMDFGDNCTNDISERLHICNVKKAYLSTKKVNDINQKLKLNNRCTVGDYMEGKL